MKYSKSFILFLLLLSLTAFKIEINNPNLRPFRLHILPLANSSGEKIYSQIVKNLKMMPNLTLLDSSEDSDYEISMTEGTNSFDVVITNKKSGENFTFKLKNAELNPLSSAHLLSDKIYEKITQTKGVFSTKIVFSMNWNGIRQIFLSDITGKEIKKLTNNTKDSIAPKLSHNRRFIVYTQYRSDYGTALRLIDLETMKDKLLLSSHEVIIAGGFEKDDKTLYYAAFDGKTSKIFEFDITNGSTRELFRSRSRIVTPVTTYNDGTIAIVSDEYGSPKIFLLDKKTKKLKKISSNPDYATSPSFVKEATHFVYLGQTNGIRNIYVASIDGSDLLPLTHDSKNYDDLVWLGNERFILTTFHNGKSSYVILLDIPTLKHIELFKIPAKISYLAGC